MGGNAQPALYEPLDTSKRQIRLVHLKPGTSNAAIQCELVAEDLDQYPCSFYEALSYEWEGPSDCRFSPSGSVILDGRQVVVKDNLLWALWHLRFTRETRVLWIDALCINQGDVAERNHQVTWMGEIYRRARRVVIWLGHNRPMPWPRNRRPKHEFADIFGVMQIRSWPNMINHPLLDFFAPQQAWGLVDDFFNRIYWKRLWIIQEVVFASDILIQYGDRHCTWGLLEYILDQFRGMDFRNYIRKNWRSYLGRMDNILDSVPARLCQQKLDRDTTGHNYPLLDLILRYHDAKCQELRDKIFGLHSLAKKCCKHNVPVDYSKSPDETCQSVLQHHFVYHLTDGSDGNALCIINLTRRLRRIMELSCPEGPHLVYSSKTVLSQQGLIHLTCYLRGTILYIDRPERISGHLRLHQNASAIPMPETLNLAVLVTIRSFLKDARRYLPTIS